LAVEVIASFADAIIGVVAWLGEVLLRLFGSAIRSLRYAFSPRYRKSVNDQLERHGPLYRFAYATWGIVVVALSVAASAGIIYWIAKPDPTPAEACENLEWRHLSECARAVKDALPK
jgi:hypothetical protein